MATAPLLLLEPIKLAALVQEGAEAVQASMLRIADLEDQLSKQAAASETLRTQIATLESQLAQAKQASAPGYQIDQARALKFAGILADHNEINQIDKEAAAQAMLRDPKRVLAVMDKIATLLPAPVALRPGSPLLRRGDIPFAGESAPVKESWF